MTRARRKPGSVSDNHLSRHTVTGMLQRPTFRAAAGNCPAKAVRPFWSCSGWGLHETYVTIDPRELLPHDFTLTARGGGMFLLHFPYSYLRRTLSGILALRSPDFPHSARSAARLSVLPELLSILYNVYGFVFASAIITSMSRPFPDAFALICLAIFSVKIFSVP